MYFCRSTDFWGVWLVCCFPYGLVGACMPFSYLCMWDYLVSCFGLVWCISVGGSGDFPIYAGCIWGRMGVCKGGVEWGEQVVFTVLFLYVKHFVLHFNVWKVLCKQSLNHTIKVMKQHSSTYWWREIKKNIWPKSFLQQETCNNGS